jgi:type IV pilus assembly protein PilO
MNLSILLQIIMLRKKSLIALVVVFSLALALHLFISLYNEPQLEKLRTASLKQQEIAGRGAVLQSRELVYKNGKADLAKYREHIYLKSQFARFIGELYSLAENNSLKLSSITYKPTLNKGDQLLNYELAMAVTGKYHHLKKFINDLGSSANIMVIDSISLAATGPSADTVQLQIQVTSFFRMEGQ